MYWVAKCEFCFGIINVVEVAEQIHVNQSKHHGFAKKKVTICHRCQFKFHLASSDMLHVC